MYRAMYIDILFFSINIQITNPLYIWRIIIHYVFVEFDKKDWLLGNCDNYVKLYRKGHSYLAWNLNYRGLNVDRCSMY